MNAQKEAVHIRAGWDVIYMYILQLFSPSFFTCFLFEQCFA